MTISKTSSRALALAGLPLLLASLPAQDVMHRLEPPVIPEHLLGFDPAGDVDGDGAADFNVRGLSGIPDPFLSLISGRTGAPLRRAGFHNGERPVLWVDLNGDGILECVTTTGFYSGGDVLVRRDSPAGPVDFVIAEPSNSRSFGAVVVTLSDLDGDGVRDLAIGAPADEAKWNGSTLQGVGRVRLHSGATGALLHELRPDITTSFVLDFGRVLVALPDVDGDLVPDLVIGARGGAFLYSGATGAEIFEFGTRSVVDRFGSAIADAGDINGDGVHDVVIGASGVSSPLLTMGTVYVYSGADGALLHSVSGGLYDELGHSVAGVGDVDGDGVPDFAAGAIERGDAGPGYVRVFSGATADEIFTASGHPAGRRYGNLLLGLGDVNGDSVPDLVTSWWSLQTSAAQDLVETISGAELALRSDEHLVVAAAGGTQNLTVDLGNAHAGELYFVIGSATGIAPGWSLQGVPIPLQFDFWTAWTIGNANGATLVDSLGTLDAQGRGQVAIVAPQVPELRGLTLHHAALTIVGATVTGASQPVPLTFW